MNMDLEKVFRIKGEISVPGDKSISHRSLIIPALAFGDSRITNFLYCDDCLRTLECIKRLGVEIKRDGENRIIVKGKGLFSLKEPDNILDVGNSGTTIRILSGVLAAHE
ncbi:MAG: 3-phosphoshikimate 1-carboxyvinyltransferase, partial [Actinomycetia bacterium]|nr:3-phosphoshikimate 1-carboxyvinyltransferase [Actinomycetes bacterium]